MNSSFIVTIVVLLMIMGFWTIDVIRNCEKKK